MADGPPSARGESQPPRKMCAVNAPTKAPLKALLANKAGAREDEDEEDAVPIPWGPDDQQTTIPKFGVWNRHQFNYFWEQYSVTGSINERDQRRAIQTSLAKWSAVSNVKFAETDKDKEAQIRFKFAEWDHGDGRKRKFDGTGFAGHNYLAHAFFPGHTFNEFGREGDVHFDDSDPWNYWFLGQLALHEVGHALGLGHSELGNAVMFEHAEGQDRLQPDDIAAMQNLYGPSTDLAQYRTLYPPSGTPEAEDDTGIAGFDFSDPRDRAFGMSFLNSRSQTGLVVYRPGTGKLAILKPVGPGQFESKWSTENGIGSFDLKSDADRALAFDFESKGSNDHILLYRPGSGWLSVAKWSNEKKTFLEVFASKKGLKGLNSQFRFDLSNPKDQILAFDGRNTGCLNTLVAYRPGSGVLCIFGPLKNPRPDMPTDWLLHYKTEIGIGDQKLDSSYDLAFALDLNSDGKSMLNHLVLYRPGYASVSIFAASKTGLSIPTDSTWTISFNHQVYPRVAHEAETGIGGLNLDEIDWRGYALDYEGTGNMNHIVFYRPGYGAYWIMKRQENGYWAPVYQQGTVPGVGNGIGGFNLMNYSDLSFAYDSKGNGKNESVVCYRPGFGKICIAEKV